VQRDYALRASDPKYPWWNRQYFFNYYPVEQGGSQVKQIIVGRTYDIFSLGPLELTNSGKVSWNGWKLSISQEKDLPTDGFSKNLDGTDRRKPVPVEQNHQIPKRYSFGISPPRGNIYTSNNWSISGSLRLGLKSELSRGNGSSITVSIRALALAGYHHKPWLAIDIKGKAQPISQEYGVQISISLLTF